jgi:hypothetical protein
MANTSDRIEGVRDALKVIPHSAWCDLIDKPGKGQVCSCHAREVWKAIHDLYARLTSSRKDKCPYCERKSSETYCGDPRHFTSSHRDDIDDSGGDNDSV